MQTETKQCRYGKMTYLPHDQYIGRSLQVYGEYSEMEMMLVRQLLRPGDVALDIGANIGILTLGMAQMVGPQGTVHAFEPQRAIHELLSTNVTQNGLKNVVAHREAVGAAAGTIRVPPLDYDKTGNFGGVVLGGEEGDEVPVVTIDSLQLLRLRLMKIDVEGMEVPALTGAKETIRRLQPALYVENDRSEHSGLLIAHIFSLGYRLWWYLTPMFNPDNFSHRADDVFGNVWSCNMIGLPRTAGISLPFAEVSSPRDEPTTPDGKPFRFTTPKS